MAISKVAEAGFAAGAEDYERGRPSYPEDAVRWLIDHLSIGPGARVADVAAGTGKLTRLLVPTGADLVGVEPVAPMREKFTNVLPEVAVVDGTAEALPFPTGSFDAVTVAQAFHWFDPTAALREIARVLKPRGALGIVFNERDTRTPWVAELSRLIRWDERGAFRVPYTVEVDWSSRLAESSNAFERFDRYDTIHRQRMDVDTLVARVLSTSYLAPLGAPERADLATRVRALVAELGQTFELPYVTVAYAARRAR